MATGQPIPLRPVAQLECRNCGAGAPVDDHFCPQCSRILAIGRHGDYFAFFGLPRRLQLDVQDLEKRFRDLSRKFHPDFYYNAPPAERLASLERSSYLNDAYRTLREPVARIEHLLALEGLQSPVSHEGAAKVPPALLEEVFALNEELDEIREARAAGADAGALDRRLESARQPIERKRDEHQRQLQELMSRWDTDGSRPTLDALRDRLLERNYINNLLAAIDREAAETGSRLQAADSGDSPQADPGARRPEPGASGG